MPETERLQRAYDPHLRKTMRPDTRVDAAFEADGAGVRRYEAADDVEEGRLAGSVRPDQADDLASPNRKRHGVERLEAAERDANAVDLQASALARSVEVPISVGHLVARGFPQVATALTAS